MQQIYIHTSIGTDSEYLEFESPEVESSLNSLPAAVGVGESALDYQGTREMYIFNDVCIATT